MALYAVTLSLPEAASLSQSHSRDNILPRSHYTKLEDMMAKRTENSQTYHAQDAPRRACQRERISLPPQGTNLGMNTHKGS